MTINPQFSVVAPVDVVNLHFARNFGHQIAIAAGMDHARGDGIGGGDSGVQDPPEVIPDLIAKWREDYEAYPTWVM